VWLEVESSLRGSATRAPQSRVVVELVAIAGDGSLRADEEALTLLSGIGARSRSWPRRAAQVAAQVAQRVHQRRS
jgi:hypothetical protein